MKNKIKELRSMMSMTQEQLAHELRVSRQTIISIENGRFNPSLILAYRVAQVFGCKIEEVFDFNDIEEVK